VKLVFVTQELDPEHPALAQSIDLVQALAERVDELSVVTRRVRTELPANATALTFDSGTRIGRTLSYELAFATATRDADAALVHMVPQFALLGAPIAKVRRIPLMLWYTHWHASRALAAATRVVDVALSVAPSSYPVHTSKLRAIGHAIDVDRFRADAPAEHDGPLRLLALGRTARWKGLSTLLDALALVEEEVHLDLYGPSLTDDERAHRAELERRIESGRLPATLHEPVARDRVPALIGSVDAVVSPNEPRSGLTLDKAVFEAAACARPVVSTSPAFAQLLGGLPLELIAPERDPAALAAVLDGIARAPVAERASLGAELRSRVVAHHSLQHWADAVIAVAREVRSSRGTAGSPEAG
jgi:glycosyltransferase involved in cell wall biosynthesis